MKTSYMVKIYTMIFIKFLANVEPVSRLLFCLSAASKVDPQHLEYFNFSGRIIALPLMHKVQVGIAFDRAFFLQLAGNYVTLEDIQDTDPYLYSSCKQILEMDVDFIDSDALELTFIREEEELGHRDKYVDLLIQDCFVSSISEQVSHFGQGFADILSDSSAQQFFKTLELEYLDWMLHGNENIISIEDWKAHTEYKGYEETDPHISWFWEIVGRMSIERRTVLLFFGTSVKYLPSEGFHGLASHLYVSKIPESDDSLPSSSTCFYTICFPPYSSMTVMEDRLRIITQAYCFGTG
ncbi:hypothetical protein L6164_026933 [Bauhinia variegata]|uniref:Uncharacterized protein n=1 Tax=Bauhinia variegata TaxID=167791 RepID=A0ACB9LRF4_BAUVA|nr:hypothetical protein L6164_026933 [Bauhinia variegata]